MNLFYFVKDIDECSLEIDNCDFTAQCTNTDGSFMCACISGFVGDGVNCIGKLS